jgi:hypothetical protein
MKRFPNLGLLVSGLVCMVALPAGAADPDKLMPSDADGVVVVNVRQILDSALV